MRIIKTAYERFGAISLCLGFAEENAVTEIRIDLSAPLKEYPGAWFGIAVENPEGVCYPAVADTEGDTLIWVVSSADTSRSGRGNAQVIMYGEDGEIGRSHQVPTAIMPSIKATGNAPDPVEEWIDEALKLLEELKHYEVPAEQVEQIVRDYLEKNPPAGGSVTPEQVQAAVNEALESAKESGEFDGEKGQDGGYYTPVMEGTVLKGWEPSNDDMLFIEQETDLRGRDGDDGKDGGYYTPQMDGSVLTGWTPSKDGMLEIIQNTDLKGDEGHSPEVTLTRVENGVRIDVKNKDSTYSETVYDGKDGEDAEGGGTVIPENIVTDVNGQTGSVNLTASDVGALPATTQIPAATSDLTNDSGFITKAVTDLTSYYLKSETYTRDEINQRLSEIPKFSISVVTSLPTSGISETTIYLVKSGADTDLYTEYIRVNGAWEILGSQRVDLTGYATETWVVGQLAGYQPKGDYLLADELPTAVEEAIAQAKESGEFDGATGSPGKDGGYYTPVMEGTVLKGWEPSNDDMYVIEQNVDLQGQAGTDGADGGYYTPQMNGTVLTGWTPSKEGMPEIMQSIDLQGPAGAAGTDGKDGTSVTVKSVSESSADGGSNIVTFSDGNTVTIKNGSKGSTGATGSAGADGDDGVGISSVKQTTTSSADGGSNVVTVTLTNGQTSTFTVKNGSKGSTGATGATGPAGSDATVTSANIVSALGYTPANAETVSQLSEAIDAIGTQEEIVQQVIAALGTPVFGTVDADNNIVLTGELAEGTYTIKYEDADGEQTTIGTLTTTAAPTYTNVLPLAIASDGTPYNGGQGWKSGTRLNSSGAESTSSATEIEVTGFIPVKNGDTIYLSGITMNNDTYASQTYMWLYDSSFTKMDGRYRLFSQYADDVMSDHQASGYIDMDDSGNITKLTVQNNVFYTGATLADLANTAYLRISCEKIDENSIITVNEPIV